MPAPDIGCMGSESMTAESILEILPVDNMLGRLGLTLLRLPLIVAIAYEFNRLVGRHDNKLTRFLSKPGMWLQLFTTQEPDDSMLEVGIRALELVLPEHEGEDQW